MGSASTAPTTTALPRSAGLLGLPHAATATAGGNKRLERSVAIAALLCVAALLLGNGNAGTTNGLHTRTTSDATAHAMSRQSAAAPTATDPAAAHHGVSRQAAAARAEQDGVDPSTVASNAQHTVSPSATKPGALEAGDAAYGVRFDADGFTIRPTDGHATMQIALSSITRGANPTQLDPQPWTAHQARTSRTVGDGITEQATVRNGELEWYFVLAHRPSGTGDLTVTADLDGVARAHASNDTLHLTLDRGTTIDMGQLVVKDAIGAVLYRALPTVEGATDTLVLQVPSKVLDTARYPLTVDPTISPERTVNARAGTQVDSDIAFDGTNYLVVWEDVNFEGDIYGARVKPDGTVLDPSGFRITTNTDGNVEESPTVVWYGPQYLVVWADNRNAETNGWDIYGARVNTNGTVLDTSAAPFSTAPDGQYEPDIAFNGTNNFLVVWDDYRLSASIPSIFATRFTTAAGVVDPGGFRVTARTGHDAAAIWTGSNFLVAWTDTVRASTGQLGGTDIYAARVNTSGTVLDTGISLSASTGDQAAPSLAYDGTNVLAVWEDKRNGAATDVYGTRWSPTSGVLNPTGIAISTGAGTQDQPAAGFNGKLLVVWRDTRNGEADLYGTRIGADGSVTDAGGFPVSVVGGAEATPSLVKGDGGNIGLAYDRPATGGANIFHRTVSSK